MSQAAAILCPGPSLAQLSGVGGFHLVIGVNRAATRFACHVWSACDYQLFLQVRDEVIGWPVLLTNRESARRIRWTQIETFESLPGEDGRPLSGCSFSAIAAVWCAVARGFRDIRVFGADLAGSRDFDGVEAGENRTDARWAREGELWMRLEDVLAGRGILLRRSSKERP